MQIFKLKSIFYFNILFKLYININIKRAKKIKKQTHYSISLFRFFLSLIIYIFS